MHITFESEPIFYSGTSIKLMDFCQQAIQFECLGTGKALPINHYYLQRLMEILKLNFQTLRTNCIHSKNMHKS